jgi:hypothetical protein
MLPLVVTLALDAAAQARFDAERARLYPDGSAGAHVTLFHSVPGELETAARLDLSDAAGPAFRVGVAGVLPLARGAAYALASAELTRRHHLLQQLWWPQLTDRDQKGLRAHLTVQNDASPAEARATVSVLRRAFRPHDVSAVAFVLWRDDGGGWTELERFPFPPPTDLVTYRAP